MSLTSLVFQTLRRRPANQKHGRGRRSQRSGPLQSKRARRRMRRKGRGEEEGSDWEREGEGGRGRGVEPTK